MDLFNHLIMGAGLPTLSGVKGWVLDIVTQFIVIVVVALAAKHFVKLKIGGIVAVCVVGSAVTWTIRHWSQFSGWVDALMNKL
ncbi:MULTISPECIES: hypothetical protein [Bacillus amyloliquefaciens group]|uniref:Uncharacterized protein n=1 Tax=Bacillus velezensis TaxID=492670 RepID=A0ABC8D0H7_BACVE|nr:MULTISPECIES: hypothetical protein [Bacillus amyloliquefaciens group]AKL75106.1 hypothetical protein ABH13_0498 [Bacillus velezensis]AVI27180.1 hypothetical protein C3Z10_01730 [Bacillus velezensis]AWX70829.1 hypothetical protein BVDSYZ_01730 [Bacillus velezensis]MDK2559366.1 hypothetical protein [Bacillus amyloliquefaciens]ODB63520.1 hypothetical protein A7313_19005 [Bacillus velezensis]